MKIVRIRAGDDLTYGLADTDGVTVYEGSPFVAWEPTERVVPWDNVQLLSPVIPTKVVAVGRNYVDHAAEMEVPLPDEPIIFLKPPTSVIGPGSPVVYPSDTELLHHEAELAVVLGTRGPVRQGRGRRSCDLRVHLCQRCHRPRPAAA